MPYDATTGLWKPEDDSTANQLTGLLSKTSPYLTQAKTEALQDVNKRGLLNSSIAIGAAQTARIKEALPIASQDASQIAEKNLSTQNLAENRNLAEQGHGFDVEIENLQAGNRSALSAQEAGQVSALSTQQAGEKQAQTQLESAEQLKLDTAKYEQETSIANLETASRERIAQLDVDARNLDTAARSYTSFAALYSDLYSDIINNPDLPAETRDAYLEHILEAQEANFSLVEQLYGFDVNWGASDFISDVSGGGGTDTGGGGTTGGGTTSGGGTSSSTTGSSTGSGGETINTHSNGGFTSPDVSVTEVSRWIDGELVYSETPPSWWPADVTWPPPPRTTQGGSSGAGEPDTSGGTSGGGGQNSGPPGPDQADV